MLILCLFSVAAQLLVLPAHENIGSQKIKTYQINHANSFEKSGKHQKQEISAPLFIPTIEANFAPKMHIQTSYIQLIENSTVTFVTAKIEYDTTMPSLFLDNIPEIEQILCPKEVLMTIKFDNQKSALKAFREWVALKELVIMTGHEHKCNGNDEGTFLVNEINHIGNYIYFHKSKLRRSDIAKNWQMSISYYPFTGNYEKDEARVVKIFNQHFGQESAFRKSFIFRRAMKFYPKASLRKIRNLLLKLRTWKREYSFRTSLTNNFNETTKSIIKPRIAIYGILVLFISGNGSVIIPWSTLDCLNCYTNGSVELQFVIKGKYSFITYQNFHISGHLDGMIYFFLKQYVTFISPLLTVFSIPFAGFTIPGIIQVGPVFQIKAGLSLQVGELVDIGFGWFLQLFL